MRISLVLTLSGRDRPGLVSLLAKTAAANGANWEESRMAHLAGHFVGLLHLSVPEASVAALTQGLRELDREGLAIEVSRGERDTVAPDWPALQLGLVGNDREGIVSEVAGALARRGVNVEELTTERESAPHSGGMLFRATARLRCPPKTEIATLRAELEAIAGDLMVEIVIDEAKK